MSTGSTRGRGGGGLAAAVAADVRHLHGRWMGLVFSQRREGPHPVMGAWRPESPVARLAFLAWAAAGAGVVALLYPFAVVGLGARYYARRANAVAAALGLAGVLFLVAVASGLLVVLASFRFSGDGFVAVLAAGVVAVPSAAVAILAARRDGRLSTVLVAYPAGVTAVFLPPVMAALFSPALGSVVLPQSYSLAVWLLDNVLAVGGLASFLRETFELAGFAYLGMWFAISVPLGWVLGVLATLADLMRPAEA